MEIQSAHLTKKPFEGWKYNQTILKYLGGNIYQQVLWIYLYLLHDKEKLF